MEWWEDAPFENSPYQCDEVQCLLDITIISTTLFTDDGNFEGTYNWNSWINLVVDNTKIIDNYEDNVLLFKETIKIKPALIAKIQIQLQMLLSISKH